MRRKLPVVDQSVYEILIEALYSNAHYHSEAMNNAALSEEQRAIHCDKREAVQKAAQEIIDGSTVQLEAEDTAEIQTAILAVLNGDGGNKVAAIKEYRALTRASLKAAKDYVEALMDQHHITYTGLPPWRG